LTRFAYSRVDEPQAMFGIESRPKMFCRSLACLEVNVPFVEYDGKRGLSRDSRMLLQLQPGGSGQRITACRTVDMKELHWSFKSLL